MRRVGAGKAALLWVFSLLFGLADRGTGDTFGGHLAAALSDQYYCVFAVLPILLLIFGTMMEDDPEPVILRHGAYFRYFLRKWLSECLLAIPLWAGQLAALALSGAGLPSGGWGRRTDVLRLLASVFPGPLPAIICAALHLLAGYWLVALLTLWLGHFLPRTRAVGALAALYVLTVFRMKLPIMSRPPLSYVTGLSHWLLMLHNLTEPRRFPLTLAVTAVFLTAALVSTKYFWRRKRSLAKKRPHGLGPYYRRSLFSRKNLLLSLGLTVMTVLWNIVGTSRIASGRDWTVMMMAGHGVGRLYFPGMIIELVTQLLPLWPPAVLATEALSGGSVMLAVRLRRKRELTRALLGTAALWLALWLGLVLSALVLPPLVMGFGPDLALSLTSVALRGLDMSLQLLLLMVMLALTGSAAAGFAVLAAAHMACALPIPHWPVGLSSLARLTVSGGAVAPAAAALELIILCAAPVLWLCFGGSEFLFEKCGGSK